GIIRQVGSMNTHTDVWIQNVGAGPADIIMELIPCYGSTFSLTVTDTIPVAASHVYRTFDMLEPGGNYWPGSAMIQASGSVAVEVMVTGTGTGSPLFGSTAYNSVPPDRSFHIPRAQRNVAEPSGVLYSALY